MGTSWTPVNSGLTNLLIESLTVNGNALFAGTTGGGVFRSTDDGARWTQINSGLTSSRVYSFVVSGMYLFAGTSGGVFRSRNNGTNWTDSGLTDHTIAALAVEGTYIYAGTTGGVFRSADDGASWTQINFGLGNSPVYSFAAIDTILFGGSPGGGVFRSNNHGASWAQAKAGLTNADVRSLAVFDSVLFAGTLDGLYLSTNNGTTWNPAGLPSTYVTSLVVNGRNLFAGTSGEGVYFSASDGARWTQVLTRSTIYSLAVSPDRTHVFAGTGSDGVLVSSNSGISWTQSGLADVTVYSLAVSSNGALFAGTHHEGIFLSTNNGTTWADVNSGLMASPINSLAVRGNALFAGTDYGVWTRPLSEMMEFSDEPPPRFRLEPNSPNPFNPKTNIPFTISERSHVILNVHDLLGQPVATVIDEVMNPGSYEATWDATGFATGVYFCQLRAGAFMQTRRLVLVK
jgi:photosystem II stability/assembly factor-like uncharacterized protein